MSELEKESLKPSKVIEEAKAKASKAEDVLDLLEVVEKMNALSVTDKTPESRQAKEILVERIINIELSKAEPELPMRSILACILLANEYANTPDKDAKETSNSKANQLLENATKIAINSWDLHWIATYINDYNFAPDIKKNPEYIKIILDTVKEAAQQALLASPPNELYLKRYERLYSQGWLFTNGGENFAAFSGLQINKELAMQFTAKLELMKIKEKQVISSLSLPPETSASSTSAPAAPSSSASSNSSSSISSSSSSSTQSAYGGYPRFNLSPSQQGRSRPPSPTDEESATQLKSSTLPPP